MTTEPKKRTRTCIGCGNQGDKVSLYRIVRTSDGSVSFDSTGRVAGRGAYVCSRACFERASAGALQRALRCNVKEGDRARVAHELDQALSGALAR